MTHDQIKRAAVLLDAIAKLDKEIAALATATEVTSWARNGSGGTAGKFERTRKSGTTPWPDDRGEALHRFMMDGYRAARAKLARELRQLDVAVPEPSP